MMMPVDMNRWRAAIGCFRAIVFSHLQVRGIPQQYPHCVAAINICCFCYLFILLSVLLLPFAITAHFISVHTLKLPPPFLHLFSYLYHFATSTTVYKIPKFVKQLNNFYRDCIACCRLSLHTFRRCTTCEKIILCWLVYMIIMLCGDVETNPGPDTFNFCCWNLNSITSYDFLRISLIEAYNSVCKYDLIGVVETHLNDSDDESRLQMDGYSFVKSNHPLNIKRGGVALYVKDSIPMKHRYDLVTLPECVVCEIHINKRKYFFTVVYRAPCQDQDEFKSFSDNFELLISNLQSENPFSIVITGDFNCRSNQWWGDDIENTEGKLFEPLTSDLGLHQLISEPTHLMNNSKSCIDLIFTDQPNLFVDSGVHPTLHEQCHHQIVYGKLSISTVKQPPYTRHIWFYDKSDTSSIKRSIELFDWQKHLGSLQCPNEQVKLLNETLINIYSNFIPNKTKKIRPNEVPWMTRDIKNFLRKRNRIYRNAVKKGHLIKESDNLKKLIANGATMIKNAKRNYFMNVGKSLAQKTSTKVYWSLINKVLNKSRIPPIPPLLENGEFVTDFAEKAQLFNDHFARQCSTIDTGSVIPSLNPKTTTTIADISISDEGILSIIRSLNPSKAHGCDEISVRMIKQSDSALIYPLKLIFKNSIRTGVFPDIWKLANVVPVHKKGQKNLLKNYRPISLLPIFGKIFEKLIYNSLYTHIVSCNLLHPNQSGFRSGDSTINQLLSITNYIFQAFDCNPPYEVRSVFLDLSKAFDRVWHDGLISKLQLYGVSGPLLTLIQNFLTNRKHRTVLNGKCSNWKEITAGVPQGSILGPLFFLVYINDLTDVLKCNVKLFADDTSIFRVVDNPIVAASDLNHDLEAIESWAKTWRMSFNPDPSKRAVELRFSTRKEQVQHPDIFFNGVPVDKVTTHKHLGLTLDSKLSFEAHIKATISKARKAIGLLRMLSKYLPRNALCQVYKSYVRSQLDYGDVVYHNPSKTNDLFCSSYLPSWMEKLESVQYAAALAVTGAWRETSREKLYNELGWESLDSRRWCRRLTLFYKITNNLTPNYTRDPIPPLHQSEYSLRNQDVIGQLRPRTERFKSSFYPFCLTEWNKLDHLIKASSSVSIFKAKLLVLIRPNAKSVYGIHDPVGLSYLTQLRVSLSKLNLHKFKHNFRDAIDAMCPSNDGIESEEHFLLLCPSFDTQRRSLLDRTLPLIRPLGIANPSNELLSQILLYGCKDLPADSNREILHGTISFIRETGRFN